MNPNRTCAQWTILRPTLSRVSSLLSFCFPDVKRQNHSACIESDVTKPSTLCPNRFKWDHPNFRMLLHNNLCSQFTSTNPTWNQAAGKAYAPWQCDVEDAERVLQSLDGVGWLDDMEPTLTAWRALLLPRHHHLVELRHTHSTAGNIGFASLEMSLQQSIIEHNSEDLKIDKWAREYLHSDSGMRTDVGSRTRA
jgi:hypothetical protein